MTYRVIISQDAIDTLKRIDRPMAARIYSWIGKNLEGCSNPRRTGKSLHGNHAGEWRYRVGDYRILAKIEDEVVTIYIIEVGHRSNVYD